MSPKADRGYKMYFRYVKIDDVKCGICLVCEGTDRKTTVKMKNSNTSGLIKHLRLHHPLLYKGADNGAGDDDNKSFLEHLGNSTNEFDCKTIAQSDRVSDGSTNVPKSQPGCSYSIFGIDDVQTSTNSSRKRKLSNYKMNQPSIKLEKIEDSAEVDQSDDSRSFQDFPPPFEARMDLSKTEKDSPEEPDEEFLAAGRKYAFDLRDMSREQRIMAERIVGEVIYHGRSGRLNEGSGFVLRNF